MSVRILQISDLHLTGDPDVRMRDVPTHAALQDVVDHISQHETFDHVIITGDLAQDGEPEAYRAARRILGDRCAPSGAVPGNHDKRIAMRETFAEISGEHAESIRFSKRIENWKLIGIDTLDDGHVAGLVGSEQLDWLASELATSPSFPTAIFMHHHPLPVNCAWLDGIGLRDAHLFQDIVARSPHVRAICTGHVHLVSEQKLAQATVLTTPSTCIQFDRRIGDRVVREQIPAGYRVLDLHDNSFETKVVRLPELKYPPQND